MRRLDRYILQDFLLYSLMGVALFLGIYVLVDSFEKLDVFVDNHAPFRLIASYYLWGIPVILIQVLPIALLLGAILALSQLRRTNEITAMQGAGLSPIRIAAPLLLAGALIAGAAYGMGELLVPDSYKAQTRIYKVEIEGRQAEEKMMRLNVRYLGQGGTFYMIEILDGATGTMRNVTVQTLHGDLILRRIDAERATFKDGIWRFEHGFLRTFANSVETTIPFSVFATSRLRESPTDFMSREQSPFEMNMSHLKQYAAKVRGSGGRDRRIWVDYHLRASFPLANLIMILIGASLSLRIVRGSVALGIGATIGIAFVYYVLLRAGQALGYNGTMPPILAAWMGNAVFAGLGSFFFWKVSR
jgi:lipopolysaccharide export system permease protein